MARLSKRKKSKLVTKEVADVVEHFGLESALLDRIRVDDILDPELAEMWSRAKMLLFEISEHLEDES